MVSLIVQKGKACEQIDCHIAVMDVAEFSRMVTIDKGTYKRDYKQHNQTRYIKP